MSPLSKFWFELFNTPREVLDFVPDSNMVHDSLTAGIAECRCWNGLMKFGHPEDMLLAKEYDLGGRSSGCYWLSAER